MTTSFLSQWQWNLKAFSFTFYIQVNNQHTANSQCSIYLKSLRDYFVMAWINICETELLELNGMGRVSYRQHFLYNVTHYILTNQPMMPMTYGRGGCNIFSLFIILFIFRWLYAGRSGPKLYKLSPHLEFCYLQRQNALNKFILVEVKSLYLQLKTNTSD